MNTLKNLLPRPVSSEVIDLFLLIWIVIVVRLPTIIEPFDNDSAVNAYHARQIVRGEPLYGTHHPGHHLPAISYTYAAIFWLFGDNPVSLKIWLLLWHVSIALLVYRFGRKMLDPADRRAGFLAACFFIILSSHVWLKGTTGEVESFANLPCTAAILLALEWANDKTKTWQFVWVGVLCAISFWYKAVFLAPLIVSCLTVCLYVAINREWAAYKLCIHRLIWIGIGLVFSSGVVIAYFSSAGTLPGLWLAFSLGQKYVEQPDNLLTLILLTFLRPLLTLAINNFVLLLFSLMGAARLAWNLIHKTGVPPALWGIALAGWYLLSFIEAGLSPSSWVHYSLIIVPPLCLLAAYELVQIDKRLSTRLPAAGRRARPLTILVGLACFISLLANFNFQVGFYRYWMGNLSHDSYFEIASLNAKTELVLRPLVTFIRTHTTPEDRIFVWSDYDLYYQTDRRPPVETILGLYADATGPYQRIFSPQTKYIILGNCVQAERPGWLLAGLEKDYVFEATISGLDVYRHRERQDLYSAQKLQTIFATSTNDNSPKIAYK